MDFPRFLRKRHGRTDRPTDRPTDKVSYRDARTHLKRSMNGEGAIKSRRGRQAGRPTGRLLVFAAEYKLPRNAHLYFLKDSFDGFGLDTSVNSKDGGRLFVIALIYYSRRERYQRPMDRPVTQVTQHFLFASNP